MVSHQATLEEDVTLFNGQTSSSLTGRTSGLPLGQLKMANTFQMPMLLKLRLLPDFAVARAPRLSIMCQKQKDLLDKWGNPCRIVSN